MAAILTDDVTDGNKMFRPRVVSPPLTLVVSPPPPPPFLPGHFLESPG